MTNQLLRLIASTVLLVTGASANVQEAKRKAQWIWLESDGPKNTWVAFRKEFDLQTVTESAIANISTDTKYWLWINGENRAG